MSLKQKIADEINSGGPMPIDRYMALCNTHYYATRDPLGEDGDFITAPEISQVFGEMIAIWAITEWEKLGQPEDCAVVEFGPGRGTLMDDFLRGIKIMPHFQPEIHMVETSPVLKKIQQEKLHGINIKWHGQFPVLGKPAIVIANEFFDALPVKQFVGKTERMVVNDSERLAFNLPAEDGAITEICADGKHIMKKISAHASAGVIIDYGYFEPKGIDTLQALKGHQFQHFLENPGEADLTAHVDFEALANAAEKPVKLQTQRDFLLSFGADVRARILGVEDDLERLVTPEQMGTLFKVLTFGEDKG